jgi:hypothetical protein
MKATDMMLNYNCWVIKWRLECFDVVCIDYFLNKVGVRFTHHQPTEVMTQAGGT